MKIKKVTLKGIKRSYRHLEDDILGQDMGWWLCERQDAMATLRKTGSIQQVLAYGKGLAEYLEEYADDFDAKAVKRVVDWYNRWSCHYFNQLQLEASV